MKIKITDIHPGDAWYKDRADIIGLVGTATKIEPSEFHKGFYHVWMISDNKVFYRRSFIFAYAKYEKVK